MSRTTRAWPIGDDNRLQGLFDDFSRPDATVLGNGWTTVAGAFGIQSAARAAEVRTITPSGRPVRRRPGDFSSFISVDSNLGPRFALLVRYKDPWNYHALPANRWIERLADLKVVGAWRRCCVAPRFRTRHRGSSSLRCRTQDTTLTLTFGAVSSRYRRGVLERQREYVRGISEHGVGSALADRGQFQSDGAVVGAAEWSPLTRLAGIRGSAGALVAGCPGVNHRLPTRR
jgi:hypothetical protein